MSKLNRRGSPRLPMEKAPSAKPTPAKPVYRENQGDARQRRFEGGLARKHEQERNRLAEDVARQKRRGQR